MRHRRAGFTLVELLVVIGIIIVLIAILLPSLSKARSQANTIACAANLHAIGQALMIYANDNKGFVPRDYPAVNQDRPTPQVLLPYVCMKALGYSGTTGVPTGASQPTQDLILAPLFAQMPVLHCPAFSSVLNAVTYTHPVTGRSTTISEQPWQYVTNSFDFDQKSTTTWTYVGVTKITRMHNSSEYIYVMDSSPILSYTDFAFHDVWHMDQLGYAGVASNRLITDNRHQGGNPKKPGLANCLYFDFHVQTIPRATLTGRMFHPTGYVTPPT